MADVDAGTSPLNLQEANLGASLGYHISVFGGFAPDSQHVRGYGDGRDYLIALDGSPPIPVASNRPARSSVPVYSPDGMLRVYTVPGGNGRNDLNISTADGSTATRIAVNLDPDASLPVWLP